MKICRSCKNNKSLSEFTKHDACKFGVESVCKDCKKIKYIKNQNHILENKKKYYEKNKELIRTKQKNYYDSNSHKIIQQKCIYTSKKLKTDLNYRLKSNLRSRLFNAIKGDYKKGSAISDLGCSISFFRDYIASKFKQNMSWDNYGYWHIDHIIPLASFNLNNRDEILKACHYTNLQPLWAKENLLKGSRLI